MPIAPLPVKVLQFGEGNFLRGFADWMIDIANEKGILHHGVSVIQPIEKGATSSTTRTSSIMSSSRAFATGNMSRRPAS